MISPFFQWATVQNSTLNFFPVGGDDLSIRTGHRSFECSREIGDLAGIVTLAEENLVGPVPNLVVWEGFEEGDCLFLVGWSAVGR